VSLCAGERPVEWRFQLEQVAWPQRDGRQPQETIASGVTVRIADAPCRGMTARPWRSRRRMYTACNGRLALRMTIPFAISIHGAAVTYFRGVPGKHAVLKITFMKQHI